jgi:hypothetical protein
MTVFKAEKAISSSTHWLGDIYQAGIVTADKPYRFQRRVPDELSNYESYNFPDWNSEGAEPITPETVRAARRISEHLPRTSDRPHIAAGADGTIGFEWRYGSGTERTVDFIEVGPGATVSAMRLKLSGVVRRWDKGPLNLRAYQIIDQMFPRHQQD